MRTDVGLGKGHRVGRHEPILPVTQGGGEPDEIENRVRRDRAETEGLAVVHPDRLHGGG